MKIILVNYRYFISGGPERYMFNVKAALEQRGHEVIPFSVKTSRNVHSEYEPYFAENIGGSDEVFVEDYPKTLRTYFDLIGREFYSFSVKSGLKKLIKATKPDVCYLLAYKRTLSPSVIDACSELGVPVVNRISDYNTVCGACSLYRNGELCTDCFRDNDWSCIKNRCVKGNRVFSIVRYLSNKLFWAMKFDSKISAYVCTNGFMKEMMQKRGYDGNKLKVIPTFFKEQAECASATRKKHVDGEVSFLYIGNIDESKGIYDLISALEELSRSTNKFRLLIVGGLHKEENEKVLRLLKEKGIDNLVTFCPFRRDGKVFEYYRMSNVTIIPAKWPENLPNTLIESLYFGCPVVVPNFGSFEYTTDTRVAFYYQAHSPSDLARVLGEIISDPFRIEEKSKACREFFAENYGEKGHLEKLLELFDSVIKRK